MKSIAVFRNTLFTVATAFGALGIFFLYYYTSMSPPVGDYAIVFSAAATTIPWFAERLAGKSGPVLRPCVLAFGSVAIAFVPVSTLTLLLLLFLVLDVGVTVLLCRDLCEINQLILIRSR